MNKAISCREQFRDSPLGHIPKDWSVYQIGELIENIIDFRGKTPKKIGMDWGGGEIPALSANNVAMGRINLSKETYYGSEKLYQRWMKKGGTERGDIILTMEAPLGNIAQIPDDKKYILSQRVILLKPKQGLVFNNFLKHQLMSNGFQFLLKKDATGTTATGIQQSKLVRLPVALPLLREQQLIAEILDTVDEAIARTESLIAKLKQMKAGLLRGLLTRGLDEHGQLRDALAHPEQFKDSPMGQIPKDWEVRTCESVCREIVVGVVVKPSQYYQASGVPALRSANIRETGLDPSNLVFMSEQSNRLLAKSIIRTGDVLTVRTGYPGTSCVVPPEFDSANCVDIIISRPGTEIESAFLATWINSDYGKGQVLRVQGGLAQQHFNVGELQKLLIAKPSLEEQRAIQAILNTHDTRIRAEEAYRNKLQLQKKGLMHDLLTGKVRVNNAEPAKEDASQLSALTTA